MRVSPRESQCTETHSDLRRQGPGPISLASRNRPALSRFGCIFVSFYGFFPGFLSSLSHAPHVRLAISWHRGFCMNYKEFSGGARFPLGPWCLLVVLSWFSCEAECREGLCPLLVTEQSVILCISTGVSFIACDGERNFSSTHLGPSSWSNN